MHNYYYYSKEQENNMEALGTDINGVELSTGIIIRYTMVTTSKLPKEDNAFSDAILVAEGNLKVHRGYFKSDQTLALSRI